jgi:hypothetical protein
MEGKKVSIPNAQGIEVEIPQTLTNVFSFFIKYLRKPDF